MSEPATKLSIPKDIEAHLTGVVIGVIEGESDDGRPLVSWAGGRFAQSVETVWLESPPKWSACRGVRVVLGFEGGDMAKPLLLALLDAPRRPDAVAEVPRGERVNIQPIKPKVLRIESEQELVLECGQAKIALRADGRIVILGGYILSRSKGANKIKGGTVQLN